MATDKECIFCKISNKEIKSDIVYEDEDIIAFNDINPQAPIHILVIPKKHIKDVLGLKYEEDVIAKIFNVLVKLAEEKNLKEGFRIVVNCGKAAGQEVFHLHFHLLAGRIMGWPPG